MPYVELLGGLIWLVFGGDLLVRGSVALSRRAGISPMIVGLTVVALGTSAPELVVALRAVLTDHPDLAIGNVVGSNIANVLLVFGIPALIYPLTCTQPSAPRDGAIMLAASAVFAGFCYYGPLGRPAGLVMLVVLVLFLAHTAYEATAGGQVPSKFEELERALGLPTKKRMILTLIVIGAIALPMGAELMIGGAIEVAERWGVSEAVIGLTIFAIGTSLPELSTTVVAALKRHADMAVGNVLGSNIFNLMAIMGLAAAISPEPIAIPPGFREWDLPLMLGAATVLAAFAWRRASLGRRTGIAFLVVYTIYVIMLYEPG